MLHLAAYSPHTFKEGVKNLIKNIQKIMDVSDANFNGLNLAPLLNISLSNNDPAVWETLQQLQTTYINISGFDLNK